MVSSVNNIHKYDLHREVERVAEFRAFGMLGSRIR